MAERIAPVLAGVAVAWSALQFWPLADSRTWQLLYPANAMPLAWTAVLLACVALRRRWITVGVLLPHVSVLAFLAVCLLSTAFAREASRAVSY